MLMPSRFGTERRVLHLAIFTFGVWLLAFHKPTTLFSTHDDPPSSWLSPLEHLDIFNDPPTDSDAIRQLCSKTRWNPGLLFTCDNAGAGPANLRNSILSCARYAISAGASMTLPHINERNPMNTADIWNRPMISFDHIFDQAHFVDSLKLSCPQLKVYNTTSDYTTWSFIGSEMSLIPESIVKVNPDGLEMPGEWRGAFYTWLTKTASIKDPIAIVRLERSYLQYPIYSDSKAFALDFGKILKFRNETRVLATTVLRNLLAGFSIPTQCHDPVCKKAFFGVHLRTEEDSKQFWPSEIYEYSKYDTQSSFYFQQAKNSSLKIIYVASGEIEEVRRFSSDAAAWHFKVVSKHTLLEGEDKETLGKFSYDQQALVDYLVLTKSTEFAGVGHSSFAWNIALWRHQFALRKDHLNGPQILSDDLSQVYGTVNQYPGYASCLWP